MTCGLATATIGLGIWTDMALHTSSFYILLLAGIDTGALEPDLRDIFWHGMHSAAIFLRLSLAEWDLMYRS